MSLLQTLEPCFVRAVPAQLEEGKLLHLDGVLLHQPPLCLRLWEGGRHAAASGSVGDLLRRRRGLALALDR